MNSWCSRCALLTSATVGAARREHVGLARMVHAQLDHREAVRGRQPQQRQRHADVVVQVAGRREPCVGADRCREDRRDHFLDGRLAVAARHGDERQREALAPAMRERAERGARLAAFDDRHREARRHVRDQRRGCAARGHVAEEVVRVEALALQRDEQVAGPAVRLSVDTRSNVVAGSP
jgi:hypothetical protein